MANCIICESPTAHEAHLGPGSHVHCVRCGWYLADLRELAELKKEKPDHMPRLSHRVRRMHREDRAVQLERELIDKLIADPLPSIREQQESLMLLLGDELREKDPAGYALLPADKIGFITSWVGAFDANSLFRVIRQLREDGLAIWLENDPRNLVRFNPKGWDRYEEIKRSPSQARLAFMAMPFDNAELDHVYTNCFKTAVAQTGFELRRVDERQPAGLIDDQLRVRIRAARFLIAELTTENRGVYWEAGFAEGLGRPVIYTCRKSDLPGLKTHFDTNHHLTVQWEPDKLPEAAARLKATIRATLPVEAKQSDD